jgi:hypothetical protein
MASKSIGAAGQTGSPAVVQATSEIHLNPETFPKPCWNELLIVAITLALVLIRPRQRASPEFLDVRASGFVIFLCGPNS